MVSGRDRGKSSAVQASIQTRAGDSRWQAERRLATWDRAEHPETGRTEPEDAMTSYAVVIERASDGGDRAWSPRLPGCVALGDTEDAAPDEMRRGSDVHLCRLRRDGQPVAPPAHPAATDM